MREKTVVSVLFLMVMLMVSCGGPESYKTPLINFADIVQSECVEAQGSEVKEEEFVAEVQNGNLLIQHSNILVPENTEMGIIDVDGNISYEGEYSYYYLEAGEEFISVREKFRESSSEKNCYYDLKIRVKNISGGIYDLSLFDTKGRLRFTDEVKVR